MINKILLTKSFIIIAIVAISDLLTKKTVFNIVENSERGFIQVTGFFNLVKVWNPGVSFGLLQGLPHGQIIITIIAIIIMIILTIWLIRSHSILLSSALSLIIGGALGNTIDRIINGAVADFLDFYIANYHWPAFNLADSAITIGVGLLLLDEFLTYKRKSV